MLKEMPRTLSIASGALVALVGIVLVLLGAGWLTPQLWRIATHGGTARTTTIVILVVCLSALQVRRWQAARSRRRNASRNRGRSVSPIDLISGM